MYLRVPHPSRLSAKGGFLLINATTSLLCELCVRPFFLPLRLLCELSVSAVSFPFLLFASFTSLISFTSFTSEPRSLISVICYPSSIHRPAKHLDMPARLQKILA